MKKMFLFSFAALLAVGTTQVSAQRVTGGFKANANISNFIRSDMGDYNNPMRFGGAVGGFLKWDITENFALQPELMFHYKGSKLELKNSDTHTSYENWGMEIPIYAVGQMKMGSGRGYIGLGPYVGVGFSAKSHPGDVDLYDTNVLQRWDFGLGTMVGYEFRSGIQINAGYQIGFIDALDSYKDHATMLPQTVTLGLGYRF